MSAQTTYSSTIDAAYAGLVADLEPKEVVSKACESATIGFGLAVNQGTADEQAVLGGTSVIGITVRSLDREGTSTAVQYSQYEAMGVLREGYIWVEIENTGSPGDALYTDDVTGEIGAGAPGAGETALPNSTLETTVSSAGDLGLIRVKL
jgi:hypothetical protein